MYYKDPSKQYKVPKRDDTSPLSNNMTEMLVGFKLYSDDVSERNSKGSSVSSERTRSQFGW